MLGQKEDEEQSVLQMQVGNIEPQLLIEVEISFIEQAQIFEGSFQILIPRALVLMLTECRKNSQLQVEINNSSQITKVFAPKFMKQQDLGRTRSQKKNILNQDVHKILLTLESGENLSEDNPISIYYETNQGNRPQILAQHNKHGEVALMVQLLPSFLPEPQESQGLQVI